MGDAFQKKSKKGIATPKPDIDPIKRRLRIAEEDYKIRQAGRGRDESKDQSNKDSKSQCA